MGLAYRNPHSYERTYIITDHALMRLRERASSDLTGTRDGDLGNKLDQAIVTAVKAKQVEHYFQRGDGGAAEQVMCVDITDTFDSGVSIFAVVVTVLNRNSTEHVVKTVLDADVRNNNIGTKWMRSRAGLEDGRLRAPLDKLCTLAEVKPAVPDTPRREAYAAPPKTEEHRPLQDDEDIDPIAAPHMITQHDLDDGSVVETYFASDDADAKALMKALVEDTGIDVKALRWWNARPVKARVRVEFV